MIVLEGPLDSDLHAVGTALRDHFAYSLRVHPIEPTVGGDVLLPRLADTHPHVCWLRSHLSEAVRHRLLGHEEHRWFARWRQVEMAMLAQGVLLLVVTPTHDADALPPTWQALPPTWQLHEVGDVVEEYDPVAWLLRHGAGRWLTRLPMKQVPRADLVDDRGRPTATLADVAWAAGKGEAHAARLPPPALGTGWRRPEVLIIGQEPAPTPCPTGCCGDEPDVPFSRGPTSAALWGALDALGFHWWRSYVTNASTFREGSPWDFLAVMQALNEDGQLRKILCLGKEAEALARRTWARGYVNELVGRGFLGFVPHPSHVRQWRHKELAHFRDEVGRFLAEEVEDTAGVLERTGTAGETHDNDDP